MEIVFVLEFQIVSHAHTIVINALSVLRVIFNLNN